MKIQMNTAKLLLASILSASAMTAVAHPNSVGYAYDSQGKIVRDSSGKCVRTAEWASENAVAECDPVKTEPAPAPAPVILPPPVPAPVPAPAPAPAPKPVPKKVDLNADELFSTGKADLKGGSNPSLDKLAADLNGVTYDKITVTGHADRTGSKAGNQKLSEKRAVTVKNYLVGKGIPADKISTAGKGSSEPVTKPTDCKKLKGAKLQACLAPDRRVTVTVSGTK